MSLYRQPGRARATTLALVAAGAVLAGAGIGFGVGRGTAGSEPSAAAVAARLRDELRPVRAGLELFPTEYPQAYRRTGREAVGVSADAQRVRMALDAALPDLRALAPAGAAALDARIGALVDAIRAHDAPPRVIRLASAAADELDRVPGGR